MCYCPGSGRETLYSKPTRCLSLSPSCPVCARVNTHIIAPYVIQLEWSSPSCNRSYFFTWYCLSRHRSSDWSYSRLLWDVQRIALCRQMVGDKQMARGWEHQPLPQAVVLLKKERLGLCSCSLQPLPSCPLSPLYETLHAWKPRTGKQGTWLQMRGWELEVTKGIPWSSLAKGIPAGLRALSCLCLAFRILSCFWWCWPAAKNWNTFCRRRFPKLLPH